MCSGPLLCSSPCPRCRLPWAGCRRAALSRPPSRTLHFSVWCETVTAINLTGALRAEDTAELSSLHQRVGAGAPGPSGPLPQHPIPPAGSAAQHPPPLEQLQGRCLFYQRCFPPQSSVSGVGPQPVAAFPRFLPLLCFVCSQSVSFVSVFAKTIRSLPLSASPLSACPYRGRRILERSGRRGEQPQRDSAGSRRFSPRCRLCQSISPQGGRAEDGAFSCLPSGQLMFVGDAAWSAGVGGAGVLGRPGGISSAGSGGWGCRCLACRDLIRAEVCSRVCFIFNCFLERGGRGWPLLAAASAPGKLRG